MKNNINGIKTEVYSRYKVFNDLHIKPNMIINSSDEKLISDNLKGNEINKKELTKQNNRLIKKLNLENFSLIDNKKLFKIIKEKSIELLNDKNSKIIKNYIISKNQQLNIFWNKKILKFFIVKNESINIVSNRKKPEPLLLKKK